MTTLTNLRQLTIRDNHNFEMILEVCSKLELKRVNIGTVTSESTIESNSISLKHLDRFEIGGTRVNDCLEKCDLSGISKIALDFSDSGKESNSIPEAERLELSRLNQERLTNFYKKPRKTKYLYLDIIPEIQDSVLSNMNGLKEIYFSREIGSSLAETLLFKIPSLKTIFDDYYSDSSKRYFIANDKLAYKLGNHYQKVKFSFR